jgi:antirestriction protein ArdC
MPRKDSSDKPKINLSIVQPIIDALLNNESVPWVNPVASFSGVWPTNGITKHEFSGGNIFMCLMHMFAHNLRCPFFATYKQLKQEEIWIESEHISKQIILTVPIYRKKEVVDKETGEKKEVSYLAFFKPVPYYNLQHTRADWEAMLPERDLSQPKGDASSLINDLLSMRDGPKVTFDSNLSYWRMSMAAGAYAKDHDAIMMRDRADYVSDPECANTLAHEMIHATGHTKRLDRPTLYRNDFDTWKHDQCIEEVVAEAGAAIISVEYGLPPTTVNNSVAYMQHWGNTIKDDPDILWQAMSDAWAARTYILSHISVQEERHELQTA